MPRLTRSPVSSARHPDNSCLGVPLRVLSQRFLKLSGSRLGASDSALLARAETPPSPASTPNPHLEMPSCPCQQAIDGAPLAWAKNHIPSTRAWVAYLLSLQPIALPGVPTGRVVPWAQGGPHHQLGPDTGCSQKEATEKPRRGSCGRRARGWSCEHHPADSGTLINHTKAQANEL